MSLRRSFSRGALAGAFGARRLSHGLLFAAGGLLRLDDFKRNVAGYFEDYGAAPADINDGLNPLEARMYQRAVKAGGRVCVVGCGTGRDLLPFVAAGHDIVGIEPAAGPVATATRLLRERGSAAPVIHGFIEDVALPGTFDAIIFSPHCYSYIPGSARRVKVLEKVRDHLNPDGRIALNFLRRTGSWSRLGVRIAGAVARLSGSDCPWEPHDVVQWADGPGGRGLMFEHYFLPEEVHREVEAASLRVIAHELDSFLGALSVAGR